MAKMVHIVCRQGPEWCDLLEAWNDEKAAEASAKRLTKVYQASDDILDQLSEGVVRSLEIKDA